MSRRVLKIAEHEEYGYIGLAPTWMSGHQSDPLQGMGVAHDILEHGPSDRVEWQGLGGTVYVRGLTGYFSQRSIGNPNVSENLAGEFINLYHLWEGEDIPDPGKTRPVDRDAEDLIQQSVYDGCAGVIKELGYGDDTDLEQAKEWCRHEQRDRMIGWMRRGYRAACKRWRGHDAYMVMETFKATETAVDTFLASEGKDYEGAECVVVFDIDSGRAHVELIYDYE